jgi:hypothetical protein
MSRVAVLDPLDKLRVLPPDLAESLLITQVDPEAGLCSSFAGRLGEQELHACIGVYYDPEKKQDRFVVGATRMHSANYSMQFMYAQKVLMDLHRLLGRSCYAAPNFMLALSAQADELAAQHLERFPGLGSTFDESESALVLLRPTKREMGVSRRLEDLEICFVNESDDLKSFKALLADGRVPQFAQVDFVNDQDEVESGVVPIKGVMQYLAVQRAINNCVRYELNYRIRANELGDPVSIELVVGDIKSEAHALFANPRGSFLETSYNTQSKYNHQDKKNIEWGCFRRSEEVLISWEKLTEGQKRITCNS